MNSETANLNPFSEANMYPDNTKISGHGMVKKYDVRVGKTGNKYVDIILADKTGDVNAKFFNYVDGTSELFHAGDLVGYSGIVRRFNGAFQVTLDDVWRAPATVKPEDFVKSADYPSEDMYAKIITMIGTFKDAELRDLTLSIYEKYQEKLMYFPAAVKMHHAMRGGLLFHTLSIMTLAEKICQVYPQVDRDLLLCGAALHDIGKLSEMGSNELGVASEYTEDGNLVGHLVRGAMIVRFTGTKLGTSDDTLRLIEHMLLSHHGNPEFGAAVRPMFLEASLLHELDEMDARVYEFSEVENGLEAKTFSARQWGLDDVKIFNPGRVDNMTPTANLID